jgi:hypothetical protein
MLPILAAFPDLDMPRARCLWALLIVVRRRLLQGLHAVLGFRAALFWALLVVPFLLRSPLSKGNLLRTKTQDTPSEDKLFPSSELVVTGGSTSLPAVLFRFEAPLLPSGLPIAAPPEQGPAERPPQKAKSRRDEKVRQALNLVAQGKSRKAVSREIGVAESTLRAWLRKEASIKEGVQT